jgi:hypothetical protein
MQLNCGAQRARLASLSVMEPNGYDRKISLTEVLA